MRERCRDELMGPERCRAVKEIEVKQFSESGREGCKINETDVECEAD